MWSTPRRNVSATMALKLLLSGLVMGPGTRPAIECRFKSLDEGNAGKRLEDIAKLEGVTLEDGVVETLLRCSEGDLRKAITFLQSAARLVGAAGSGGGAGEGKKRKRKAVEEDEDEGAMDVDSQASASSPITVASISEIAGVIPKDTMGNLLTAVQPSSKGTAYSRVSSAVEDLVAEGWSKVRQW